MMGCPLAAGPVPDIQHVSMQGSFVQERRRDHVSWVSAAT